MASTVNVALMARSKSHYMEGPEASPEAYKTLQEVKCVLYPPEIGYDRTGHLGPIFLIWVKEAR